MSDKDNGEYNSTINDFSNEADFQEIQHSQFKKKIRTPSQSISSQLTAYGRFLTPRKTGNIEKKDSKLDQLSGVNLSFEPNN